MSAVGHVDTWSEVTLELKCENAWGSHVPGGRKGGCQGPWWEALEAVQGPGDGQYGSVG